MAEQDKPEQQPAAAEQMARVVVDADGNPVDEGDPRSARILTGAEAEAVMKQQQPAAEKAQAPAENKARTSAPENKGR